MLFFIFIQKKEDSEMSESTFLTQKKTKLFCATNAQCL